MSFTSPLPNNILKIIHERYGPDNSFKLLLSTYTISSTGPLVGIDNPSTLFYLMSVASGLSLKCGPEWCMVSASLWVLHLIRSVEFGLMPFPYLRL